MAMPFKNKIGYKIGFWMLIIFLSVYIVSEYTEFSISKKKIKKLIQDKFTYIENLIVYRSDTLLNLIYHETDMILSIIEASFNEPAALKKNFNLYCSKEPDILNSTIVIDKDAMDSHYNFMPLFYTKSDKLDYQHFNSNYSQEKWYLQPKESGKAYISEPFFINDTLCLVYSRPIIIEIQGKQKLTGVFAITYSLNALKSDISRVFVSGNGFVFVLDEKGNLIFHKDKEYIGKNIDNFLPEELSMQLVGKPEGNLRTRSFLGLKDAYIFYKSIEFNSWKIAIAFPSGYALDEYINYAYYSYIIIIIGFIAVIVFIIIFSRILSRPFYNLSEASAMVSSGQFNIAIPHMDRNDEIGIIANSFARMKKDLLLYIEKLKEETKRNERIAKELEIASEIQKQTLPKERSIVSKKNEFEIYANLTPAKEISGDFYDFFLMDDKHLFFAVADISGKGIPASLYAMVAKYIIKMLAKNKYSIEKIAFTANNEFCQDNEYNIFITMLFGSLDLGTGTLTYCNAGHNPPFVLKQDSRLIELDSQINPALGILENIEYKTSIYELDNGDLFFSYTDGLTDSNDTDSNLYGEKRLKNALKKNYGMNPENFISSILNELTIYSAGTEPFDDITLLAIRYNGVKNGNKHKKG